MSLQSSPYSDSSSRTKGFRFRERAVCAAWGVPGERERSLSLRARAGVESGASSHPASYWSYRSNVVMDAERSWRARKVRGVRGEDAKPLSGADGGDEAVDAGVDVDVNVDVDVDEDEKVEGEDWQGQQRVPSGRGVGCLTSASAILRRPLVGVPRSAVSGGISEPH
jgi:hypothetical protein